MSTWQPHPNPSLCPVCGAAKGVVLETRALAGEVMRKRRCKEGHRFTTIERVAIAVEGTYYGKHVQDPDLYPVPA